MTLPSIWVIEDNEADSELLEIAFDRVGQAVDFRAVWTGDDAMALIDSGAEAPTLVLVDLNLPGYSGLEVLDRLRANDRFSGTTVVMLSTTQRPEDSAAALFAGANAFMTKPVGLHEFLGVVREIGDRFLKSGPQPI